MAVNFKRSTPLLRTSFLEQMHPAKMFEIVPFETLFFKVVTHHNYHIATELLLHHFCAPTFLRVFVTNKRGAVVFAKYRRS